MTAVGSARVPGARPPSVLLAALAPAMLRLAGEFTDGTVTWMTGLRPLAEHVVPTIMRAAESRSRPAPRVVAGLLVSVTADEESVAAGVRRLRDAGVSEFMAAPFGTEEEQQRTVRVLAELAPSRTHWSS